MFDQQKQIASDREFYGDVNRYLGVQSISRRNIEYLDMKPKALIVQIPLVEYFERVKRYKADRFQIDLCARLQKAAELRHIERTWQIFHAESQLGKTTILSQCFPAWLFGHDPLFRYALMMYNVTRSEEHSEVVINIMNSDIHKDIFPNKDAWLESNKPSKSGWKTRARRELNDGQESLNPVGLQSGLTGSGFDWLTFDDPYANEKDAFSATINKTMQDKYDYTVISRTGLHSCIAGMFHRYSPDDFAGYLLDKGDFDYVRYASQADGDYFHEETGQKFTDPLGRAPGEYISPERRPPEYYEKAKKNKRVWLSMFQGRPSSEEGDFFNVGKIEIAPPETRAEKMRECSVLVRSWDLAATENGGDYSVGVLMGMRANGKTTVFDIKREQVNTAGRDELQRRTALEDGPEVIVTVPQDPGAGGKTTVFHIQQILKGFQVVARSVSGSKEDRARNYSSAVNSGDVEFMDDVDYQDEKKWIKPARTEMRDFPLSDDDDIVDASGDAYNECYERIVKGNVIPNFVPQRNVIGHAQFLKYFPTKDEGILIPEAFTVYIGVKITNDASLPNSAVIAARASQNAFLGESLFVLAEYKEYNNNFYDLFDWIENQLKTTCPGVDPKKITVFLHKNSKSHKNTIEQKLRLGVEIFDQDNLAGITELNWYLLPREKPNPFNSVEKASGLYLLVQDWQLSFAVDAKGLYNLRQEFQTWGYNEKNEPSAIGQVAECLRMVTYEFRTRAKPLTDFEKRELKLPEELREKTLEEQAETLSAEELAQKQVARTIKLDFEMPLKSGELGKKESGFWGEKFKK